MRRVEATTDNDGRFTAKGLTGERLIVQAQKTGYTTAVRWGGGVRASLVHGRSAERFSPRLLPCRPRLPARRRWNFAVAAPPAQSLVNQEGPLCTPVVVRARSGLVPAAVPS